MPKSIAIVGTVDTKGDQIEYLKQCIERRGHRAIVIDIGVMGPVPFQPTITREEVAKAQGLGLDGIKALNDRKVGMEKMAEGACEILKALYAKDELDGAVAVGGTMGTALAVVVMKVVPLGVPKLIISTVAFAKTITPDIVSGDDLMMIPWVGGLWGLNSMSKRCLETAAGAISGAAEEFDKKRLEEDKKKKIVGASGMGFTKCYDTIKPALAERGYELSVYHSTGMSGRILERAIKEGYIDAVLDLSAAKEMLEASAGGIYTPGEHRLEAAGEMGIPQIISHAGLGIWCWPGGWPLPEEKGPRMRTAYNLLHDDIVSTAEEVEASTKLMAKKLNRAKGPTTVVIPMLGLGSSEEGAPTGEPPPGGTPPMDSEAQKQILKVMEEIAKANEIYRDVLMEELDSKIKVIVLENAGIGDQEFINAVLNEFDEMMLG